MEAPPRAPAEKDAALRRIARRLAEAYAPEAVLLYGSRAWGAPHPRHSDADLFILKDTDEASRIERSVAAKRLLRDLRREAPPLDLFVLTPSEAAYRLQRGDQFLARILAEGRVLYEKKKRAGRSSALQRLRKKIDAMPPPEDADYPLDWIRTAEKDWQRALTLLDASDPEGAGFQLQQAVEKFLKAFLLSKGWALEKTHDLTDLLEEATTHDPFLASFREACGRIADYYFAERYPAAPGEDRPDVDMSQAAVERARTEVEPLVERLRRRVSEA